MGVYKLSTAGGITTPRTEYSSFLAGNPQFIPSAYESLQTVTVGSGGASSISFTSIPDTYKHLQIRGIGSSDRTGYVVNNYTMRFNGDSANNYKSHYMQGGYGTTPSVASGNSGLESFIYMPTGTTSAASNIFAGLVIDVLDYASSAKNKTVRTIIGYDVNGTAGTGSYGGSVSLCSGFWNNSSSPITSITLSPESFNWIQGSSFALYGIRG